MIPDKQSQMVVDVVYNKWVMKFGCPLQLHSDQGGEFIAQLFKDMCSCLRIDKTVTTGFRPQSDGLVERSNRSIQGC